MDDQLTSRRRTRLLLFAASAVPLAIVAALAVGMASGVGQPPIGEVAPGFKVAPDFTLPMFDGDTFTLSDYAGGPILVYYWASWCTVCEKVSPLLQSVWPEYQERGYVFVGINILDTEEKARTTIERHGMTFPNLQDEGGKVYLEWGVVGVPELFFFRPGLASDQKFLGLLTEASLRSKLDGLASSGSN